MISMESKIKKEAIVGRNTDSIKRKGKPTKAQMNKAFHHKRFYETFTAKKVAQALYDDIVARGELPLLEKWLEERKMKRMVKQIQGGLHAH